MRRNRRERGEGQFGCVIGILFLLVGVFIAYKMIPVKIRAAELRQVVVDQARAAGTHDDREISKAIIDTADRLKLPVTKNDVGIERRRGEIKVEVSYTVPVDFPGFTYQWKFHHLAENPIF